MKISVFTQLLNELSKYSAKNDKAACSLKDLGKINDLDQEITKCYNNGYFTYQEYRILNDLCTQVKNSMRNIIRIKNQVKALERNIRKNKLIYA